MVNKAPEGWKKIRFGKIASQTSHTNSENQNIPVFSVTKHDGFVPSLEYFDRQVFSRDTTKYKIVKKDQFAYATIHLDEGSLGWLHNFKNALISPMYTVFQIDKTKVDGKFLFELMKSPEMLLEYQSLGQGSVNRRKSISFKNLSTLKLLLPPLPEQKKIAAILSSVDEAIEATEAVIEQTRTVKKGLLQELLTRGIGHTEFKKTAIGEIPKSWKLKRLEQIALNKRHSFGLGPFGSDLVKDDYRDAGVPVVFVRDIQAGRFNWISDVYLEPKKAEQLAAHAVWEGDIVITKMGLPPGIAAEYKGMPSGVITADIIRLRVDKDIANNSFVADALNGPSIFNQVKSITAGQTRPKLTLRDYRKIRIALPPLSEQSAISEIIDGVKNSIQKNERHRSQLKKLKRGLLQDLLTGKVRVNTLDLPALSNATPAEAPAE